MLLKDRIMLVLLDHGINRTQKGFLPLLDLVEIFITQPILEQPLMEQVAAKHEISVSLLRSRVNRIAKRVKKLDPASYQHLIGPGRYHLMNFVEGLAYEVSQTYA